MLVLSQNGLMKAVLRRIAEQPYNSIAQHKKIVKYQIRRTNRKVA